MIGNKNVCVGQTPDEVGKIVGDWLVTVSTQAIATNGRFTLAISGGSMPSILATSLRSAPTLQHTMQDWHLFFTDERCVSLTDADSNYKAAQDAFLSDFPIPSDQIYTLSEKLKDDPSSAAASYAEALKSVWPETSFPEFDMILLGIGPDGHTASLFPNHKLLEESTKWVASITDSPKPPASRITLTLPVLNAALNVGFIACGSSKASLMPTLLRTDPPSKLPAALITSPPNVVWFLDSKSAAEVVNE